ncbi:class I SAM-dependent methyltransferase [Bacteroidota bacterium]
MNKKEHWDKIYLTKSPHEVSWTQDIPQISLDFIHSFNLPKSANIIDVGGGDSKLVDYLMEDGFQNITVLDISSFALERAKKRLGQHAEKINWITSDILEFEPDTTYDLWHDRATFHFLITTEQIQKYIAIAKMVTSKFMTIGTFSEDGPKKCSGFNIRQYSEDDLANELSVGFRKIRCITTNHITPFNTTQNFLFCSFNRQEKQ